MSRDLQRERKARFWRLACWSVGPSLVLGGVLFFTDYRLVAMPFTGLLVIMALILSGYFAHVRME